MKKKTSCLEKILIKEEDGHTRENNVRNWSLIDKNY